MKKLKLKKRVKKDNTKNKKKVNKMNVVLMLFITLGIAVASIVLAFALYIIITSPDFVASELYTKEPTIIYDRNNNEIARIGSKNVDLVKYDDLPQVLVDALIATEDSRFFQHNGFDAARFFKASLGQLAGKNAGGASTLSMQVMKNTFNGTESAGIGGIIRKFKDIYMAVFKLEAAYTKEEIIEFYLNSQWLSGGTLTYTSTNGVEQGSQYFFGKSVSDLTLPEASLLVGMFQNPVYYNPYSNPETAYARRAVVLSLMVRHGYITKDEEAFANSIPIQSLLRDHSKDDTNEYQAFIDFVLYQVQKETGDNPERVPMHIYSTLDSNIQSVLRDLETGKTEKWINDKIQFGVAVTSVEDGSILALSPGRNYAAKGLNRAVGWNDYNRNQSVRRQPGSTAKPIFDYGPYLEYLNGYTGTQFLDEPWSYTTGGVVRNHDNSFWGAMTMRTALVESRNIPALQAYQAVAKEVGTNKIADFVHGLGIDFGDTLYESSSIGGIDCADPLTMSAAYAAFGRGGYYIKPYSFTKIVYIENEGTFEHPVEKTRAMSEETAFLMNNMLTTAGAQGVGGSLNANTTTKQIGSKTGTTTIDASWAVKNGVSPYATPDHWVVNYSIDYSIAFWYGYDKITAQTYTTSDAGYFVRKRVMGNIGKKIFKQTSKFNVPSGVVAKTVEKDTFPPELASEFTPANLKTTEYFKTGYEPTDVSKRFSKLDNATNGNATFDGKLIHLSWNPVDTPDAIDEEYLKKLYEDNYDRYATKYYNRRIDYNKKNIGELGYQIYLKNSNGNLTSLGYTTNSNFTYTPTSGTENYTFVIKTSYSIFKSNISDGLVIDAQAKVDSNIGGIGGPTEPDTPDNPVDNPDLPTNSDDSNTTADNNQDTE